jgi:polyisoprenoid-binding protein YceI
MSIPILQLRALSAIIAAFAICVDAVGAEQTYKIGGTPAQRIVQVESDTEIETFTAKSSVVSGAIRFDPAKRTGSGKISVEARSLDTGIAKRNDQLHGPEFLDAAKFPAITFESTRVRWVKGDEYEVTGRFTLRGITKTVTATVLAKHLKASDATRKAGLKGDALQVKVTFKIMLAEFGIKSPQTYVTDFPNEVKVAMTVIAQTGL